jgi:TatD DNase family protein
MPVPSEAAPSGRRPVEGGLVDAHAHLDADRYGDRDAVVARARAAGVERIVCVGVWREPGDFGDAVALARGDPGTFAATVGFHPHEAKGVGEADWAEAEELARDPAVVAIGECGLDYHYDLSPREVQAEVFRRGIRLAHAAGKPLVVHTREADADTVRLLRAEGVPSAGGVIHCFTSDADAARAYLDLGLFISVAGVVTFRNAEAIREAVRLVPRDRLLVETDCPYLAPVPHRGKRNEPAFVIHTAAKVAELWGAPPEEVARVTGENARRFFRLP